MTKQPFNGELMGGCQCGCVSLNHESIGWPKDSLDWTKVIDWVETAKKLYYASQAQPEGLS